MKYSSHTGKLIFAFISSCCVIIVRVKRQKNRNHKEMIERVDTSNHPNTKNKNSSSLTLTFIGYDFNEISDLKPSLQGVCSLLVLMLCCRHLEILNFRTRYTILSYLVLSALNHVVSTESLESFQNLHASSYNFYIRLTFTMQENTLSAILDLKGNREGHLHIDTLVVYHIILVFIHLFLH